MDGHLFCYVFWGNEKIGTLDTTMAFCFLLQMVTGSDWMKISHVFCIYMLPQMHSIIILNHPPHKLFKPILACFHEKNK